MARNCDSAMECRLLYNSLTQNESSLILLRSRLSAIAQRLGMPEWKKENMLLVASELVSNSIKHASGRGLIQLWQQPGPVLDIVALDFGPGIANLGLAETDGYSTASTLGKGLGSIRRLSDELLVYSQPESQGGARKWNGAVFLARFYPGDGKDKNGDGALPGFQVGLFARSLSDSRYNGDRIYVRQDDGSLFWLHLDGLGHGEMAQESTANLAPLISRGYGPIEVLEAVDRQLAGSRGAVAIAGEISLKEGRLQVAGVGDMHAHFYDTGQVCGIPFAPGVLGREHRTLPLFQAGFGKKSLVVSASDGIRRNWDAANFAGLFNQHPQLIAYTLGNIMGRISDDQSICVSATG